MSHHWRVFWSDPNGSAGMAPVMAETEQEAYRQVLAAHPQARVSAVDADQLVLRYGGLTKSSNGHGKRPLESQAMPTGA